MMRFVLALCLTIFAHPALAQLDVKDIVTPGGIKAWLVEDHNIPFVSLELRFRGGASLDAPEKRGAVNLMVALLEEGAGDMDARDFAKATERLATSFSYRASDDTVSVSARFLTENRDEAMALLRESLLNPRFDPSAIERVRAQVQSNIMSSLKDPGDLAGMAFDAFVYGDHPYGTSINGTMETVANLTREDMIAAHKDALALDRLHISAVGDITGEDLKILLDDLLLGLPAEGRPLPGTADVNLPGGIKLVDFETPQSVAIFAQPGIDRDDPDFFAAYILNHILGGGSFESRLMNEVREKRGLTYGIYSYLADRDGAKLWMGSVSSANDRMAETIEVIREEWTKIHENGVTAKELQDAKTYLTGAYPLRFDGNGPIANITVAMQMDGLPTDYIATRNEKVEAVTLEDVNRVARERLDPSRLTFVIAGQPERLEATLK